MVLGRRGEGEHKEFDRYRRDLPHEPARAAVISEGRLENYSPGKVHQSCDRLSDEARFHELPCPSERKQGDVRLNGARKPAGYAGVEGLIPEQHMIQGRLKLLDVSAER